MGIKSLEDKIEREEYPKLGYSLVHFVDVQSMSYLKYF